MLASPALTAARKRLITHPIYAEVDTLERLRRFMEAHVFAVWDFMSLTKRLQRDCACVEVPWTPPARPRLARFINEVILVEESDMGPDGTPLSHVDLYVAAMDEVGAKTANFRTFIARVRAGAAPGDVLRDLDTPAHVCTFVGTTLSWALHGTTAEVAAAFLYGREAIIPDMFNALLQSWKHDRAQVPCFRYYLERHITIDADEHGPAAEAMLDALLAEAPGDRAAAEAAACDAVDARIALWDAVLASLDLPAPT